MAAPRAGLPLRFGCRHIGLAEDSSAQLLPEHTRGDGIRPGRDGSRHCNEAWEHHALPLEGAGAGSNAADQAVVEMKAASMVTRRWRRAAELLLRSGSCA